VSQEATNSPTAATPAPAGPTCAIAAGTRFEGLLSFWGEARVDGQLRGEIAARGTLDVGPDARIHGRVEVDTLIVAGRIDGQIFARVRVEVLDGAHVAASIRTPRLAVAEGAYFEGQLDMVPPEASGGSAASAA
jgi:cytoskeletal protein CcmA (bactofilin family)